MFIPIKSYAVFNVKMLIKDKIPLLWSIALPLITFLMNYENITSEWDMVYWWTYIIVCAFVYGGGIYALQLQENGSLRTIFSINYSPWAFFLGNLLTQIIFSLISITALNIIVFLVLKLSILKLFMFSIVSILYCIPIAFLCFNITLIRNVHANTINSIFTILIFALFILLNTNSPLNKFNPLLILSQMIINRSVKNVMIYIIVSLLIILISSYSISNFKPVSNERR